MKTGKGAGQHHQKRTWGNVYHEEGTKAGDDLQEKNKASKFHYERKIVPFPPGREHTQGPPQR